MDLFILTGAPGSGKTALLRHVGSRIRTVDEPAREILAEQRAIDGHGTPDRDPARFVELLLQRSIDKHEAAVRAGGPALFDRGIPDCIAYAQLLGVDPAPSIAAAARYRYHGHVYLLEPWEEIYTTDDERTMTFADTLGFHRAIVDAYDRAGYVLVEVPRGSPDTRAAFIRDYMADPAR